MKIILFDIETSPSLGWFWGSIWETNIIHVEQDWHLMSFAWKELGESKVHYFGLPDFPGYAKNPKDDKQLCQKLWELLDECDIAIAHNGDQFDIKMSNVRFLANGMTPPSPYQTIDTKKLAKQSFRFASNSLDDLAKHFGFEGKTAHTGKKLWFDCLAGDLQAWATMRKYNRQDVNILEKVYLHMRPFSKTHPNLNGWKEPGKCDCGGKLHSVGIRSLSGGRFKRQFRCVVCKRPAYGKVEVTASAP